MPLGTVFLWPQCEVQSLGGRLRNRAAVLGAKGEWLLKAEGLVPILLGLGRSSHDSAFVVGGGRGSRGGSVGGGSVGGSSGSGSISSSSGT